MITWIRLVRRQAGLPGMFALAALLLLTACATQPMPVEREVSHVFTDTADTALGRAVTKMRRLHDGGDGFHLLADGLDAFTARALLAGHAERSIDVQYYLFHDDLVGRLFATILLEAAERGVRVRILLDDMDLDGRDHDLVLLNHHPNIQIRIFNPFNRDIGRGVQFVSGLGAITRRMHNKSFTVDNVATIVGGRNIGNEYFAADPAVEFADLDVLAIGKVVSRVSGSFDRYWNSALAWPVENVTRERISDETFAGFLRQLKEYRLSQEESVYIQALYRSDFYHRFEHQTIGFYWGQADVLVDDPDKITHSRNTTALHLSAQLEPYFEDLKKELVIISPYFVPGDEGVEFFKKLVDRGVRVVIVTNSLASSDVGIVHAGYASYRPALLRAGVELYEMNKKLTRAQRKAKTGVSGSSKASLHAKTFVIDRKDVFIGSLNLDPRSFYENTEIGLMVHAPKLAEDMVRGILSGLKKNTFRLELISGEEVDQILWHGYENGKPVTFDREPYAGFWRSFGVGLLSILPFESQL